MQRLANGHRPQVLFPETPTIRFRPAFERCPRCGAALKTHRVRNRFPCTLHLGRFIARETFLRCDGCADRPVFRSEELDSLVGEGRVYGHDVMVHAGEALFRHSRTAEDIVAELRSRNVRISPTGVRELAERFIVSLGIVHAEAAPRLRGLLEVGGGFVLHLDSTCKGASAHLLTGIDEVSGLVLLNAKVPAESEVQIAAFLRSVRERFGRPAAISCDMSRGILAAVAAELRGVPVYLCHFHFLRDLGKDLLGPDYAVIRDRLRHHGVKAGLKRLRRDLKETVSADADRLQKLIEQAAQANPGTINARDIPYEALVGILAGAVLDAEHEGDGCGFPFDRPHLLFFRQAGTVLRTIEALRDAPRLPDAPRRLFARLAGLLAPLCADRVLCNAADALETRAELFDRLRTAMRLAEPGGRTGLNDDGADTPMSTVMNAVERLCEEVRNDEALMRDPRVAAMLEQIDTRREHLFAGPITLMTPAGPRLLQPQRTNNILERLFRSVNRATCRRVGRPAGEVDINRMPVDIPLLDNLDNPLYLEAVFDGASSLAERLSRVDRKILDDTLADLHRPEAGLNRKLRARMRRRATPLQIALLILTRAA